MARNVIFNQVIILFLIMLIGFYVRKKKIFNGEINKGLSELLINITLPCMIISSFMMEYDSKMMFKGTKILIYSIIIHSTLVFVGYLLFLKYTKDKRNVLRFITVFSNTGFMGYPILYGILGKTGVFYASIFNIPFNIFLWTVGVMIFTGDKSFNSIKKVATNPSTISVFVGLIIFRFSINIPYSIESTVKMVGDITTPISMMIIGSMLAERSVKEILKDITLYYGAVVRLILVPISIFLIMKLLGVEDLLINICVILEAMPAAVVTAIIAEKYDGNAIYASQSVFITTVLSIITIPMMVILLNF